MHWLNYHHLYYFYVIAQEGSVTKATKKLLLAQSTLSTQLGQFEEVIGYELFERKGKNLFLTDKGRHVLSYAHEIFSLGKELKDSLVDQEQLGVHKVQIGILDAVPKAISEALLDFIMMQGSVSVRLEEGGEDVLLERLARHDLDLVITLQRPVALATEKLMTKELSVLEYFFGGHKMLKLANIEQAVREASFAFRLPNDPSREKYEQMVFELKSSPKVLAEVHDSEIHHRLILAGKAVGVLPDFMFVGRPELIKFSKTPEFREELWAVSARRKIQNSIAQKIWKEFKFQANML